MDQQGDVYKEEGTSVCRRFFSWFFQIAVLVLLFLMIFFIINNNEGVTTVSILLGVSYVFYFILMLCSSTFSYLSNLSNAENIHAKMRTLFETPITITFHVECYHYETRVRYSGKRRTTTREKVVTFRGSKNFLYYTWKDISGIFLLDSKEAIINSSIIFIKLKLALQYLCHDAYTTNDLNTQRNQYFNENRWRDVYMDTKTAQTLTGMEEYNLIKISEEKIPFFFGMWWFILFTFIIPVAQLYKWYISSYCSFQYFVIKKEISTRVNLNDNAYLERFKKDAPQIILNRQTTTYFQDEVQPIHDTPELPNEKDLEIGDHNKVWIDHNPPGDENFDGNFVDPNKQNMNNNSNNQNQGGNQQGQYQNIQNNQNNQNFNNPYVNNNNSNLNVNTNNNNDTNKKLLYD